VIPGNINRGQINVGIWLCNVIIIKTINWPMFACVLRFSCIYLSYINLLEQLIFTYNVLICLCPKKIISSRLPVLIEDQFMDENSHGFLFWQIGAFCFSKISEILNWHISLTRINYQEVCTEKDMLMFMPLVFNTGKSSIRDGYIPGRMNILSIDTQG
jgi:hypothetical protein